MTSTKATPIPIPMPMPKKTASSALTFQQRKNAISVLKWFREGRGEARVVQPCGHLLDVECLVHWFGFLQSDLKVEVRCPVCRGLVRGVDDWAV